MEIALPDDVDLTDFELIEDARHSAVREWCVPAELLNTRAAVRLLTDAEVEARVQQRADELQSSFPRVAKTADQTGDSTHWQAW